MGDEWDAFLMEYDGRLAWRSCCGSQTRAPGGRWQNALVATEVQRTQRNDDGFPQMGQSTKNFNHGWTGMDTDKAAH